MKSLIKVMLVLMLVLPLSAQDANKNTPEQSPKKDTLSDTAYKLVFVIYELEDGKRINQRDYIMITRTLSNSGVLKIGTRVPATVKEKETQYLDVGLHITCLLREFNPGKLQSQIDISISSFALPEQNSNPGGSNLPVLRNTNLTVSPLLTPGKPTIVASIDDVNSKKRMQVEVTATKFE